MNALVRPARIRMQVEPRAVASLQPESCDRKLSPVGFEPAPTTTRGKRPIPIGPRVCSTYVSIEATCPQGCPFKGAGCYASAGFTGATVRKLDDGAQGVHGDSVIAAEATLIDRAFIGQGNHRRSKGGGRIPQDGGRDGRSGRDLRLHVAGDVSSTLGAHLLASAARRWRERGGGSVWTFTHRWRRIERKAFGSINVLASVESAEDASLALARGYAPALVVKEHDGDRATMTADGVKLIPCPAETRGATCVSCRLCLDRDLVGMRAGVSFAVHGRQADSAKRAAANLVQLRARPARAAAQPEAAE